MDDEGVGDYLKIYTEIMPDEFDKLMADFKNDPAKRLAQKFLAYEVTKIVHGEEAANRAKKMTEVLFDDRNVAELSDTEFKELAEELPNSNNEDLLEFLVETKLAESKSAARRLVEQGSIQINGAKADLNTKFSTESLVKKGKNSFAVKL
jgi:tyrosyl-tRNA synthetase